MRILVALLLMTMSLGVAAKSRCVAHRGFHTGEYTENSFDSLYSAYNLGVDAIEFDIMLTKDGVAVVNHDKTLKRVALSKENASCPLNEKVKNLTYQQIADNCLLKSGAKINVLEDILEFFSSREVMLFIELKSALNEESFDLIEKYYADRPELIRVLSFKKRYMRPIKKRARHNPFWKEIKTMSVSRVLPLMLGVDGVDIHKRGMGSLYLAKMFGKETAVYTVNSPEMIRKAKRYGVDFITTDNPELCVDLIN